MTGAATVDGVAPKFSKLEDTDFLNAFLFHL